MREDARSGYKRTLSALKAYGRFKSDFRGFADLGFFKKEYEDPKTPGRAGHEIFNRYWQADNLAQPMARAHFPRQGAAGLRASGAFVMRPGEGLSKNRHGLAGRRSRAT